MPYDPKAIEKKWQDSWEQAGIFKAEEGGDRQKCYVLEMYAYPSGNLHMGHVRNYILGDVVARYKLMQGFNVLHPVGWDSFGLPTENAAIARGIEPLEWNASCVGKMAEQFRQLGISYDWDREIDTSNQNYYHWTQWLLIKFWEKGLLYQKEAEVNWCTGCNTVLANEQVNDDQTCDRCDSPVIRKELKQWFLRITAYADRLLQDLELLKHWPERVVAMQRHWIGKQDDGSFHLHDWCVSRQRYWGAPLPFVHCEKCGTLPVPLESLPIVLPQGIDIKPGWPPPLARAEDFINTSCPSCGQSAMREADTLDTFVFSAWYYLRFTDPLNRQLPFSREKADYWMNVDQYVGGIEHATVHLVYARFFNKALYDLGLVSQVEPFERLFTQGMICKDGKKMSKSKGNVVSPDEMIGLYGADVTRLYTLFIGPPDMDAEWNENGVKGVSRFVSRLYDLLSKCALDYREGWKSVIGESELSAQDIELRQLIHRTVKRVSQSIDQNFHFHTAIAALMDLVNQWAKLKTKSVISSLVTSEAAEMLAKAIAPFAPHLAEEIWLMAGKEGHVSNASWPTWNEELCEQQDVQFVVQRNGKTRKVIEVPVATAQDQLAVESLAREAVDVAGSTRVVFVPGKLINFIC